MREHWTGDMKDTDLPVEPGSCATWTQAHTGTASRAENTIMHTHSTQTHIAHMLAQDECMHTPLEKDHVIRKTKNRASRTEILQHTPAPALTTGLPPSCTWHISSNEWICNHWLLLAKQTTSHSLIYTFRCKYCPYSHLCFFVHIVAMAWMTFLTVIQAHALTGY